VVLPKYRYLRANSTGPESSARQLRESILSGVRAPNEVLVWCFPNFVIFRPTMLAPNSWPDNPVKPFFPKCGELTKR